MKGNSTKGYYDVHADEYFRATYKADLEPLWRELTGRLRPGASILDLGSGSGRDLRHFSQLGFHTVGIDYSSNLVKLARGFSKRPVVHGDFNHLPFGDDVFDAAWSIGSLVHVPRDSLLSVLSEVHRVLKQDTLLLTSVKEGSGEEVDPCGRYNVFHSPDEWRSAHVTAGYEVLEVYVTEESRQPKQNGAVKIPWVVCLATKR